MKLLNLLTLSDILIGLFNGCGTNTQPNSTKATTPLKQDDISPKNIQTIIEISSVYLEQRWITMMLWHLQGFFKPLMRIP